MAINLKELLEINGIKVRLFNSILHLEAALMKSLPDALIIDEFNMNGAYHRIAPNIINYAKSTTLILLSSSGLETDYPLADVCLPLPFEMNQLLDPILNGPFKKAV